MDLDWMMMGICSKIVSKIWKPALTSFILPPWQQISFILLSKELKQPKITSCDLKDWQHTPAHAIMHLLQCGFIFILSKDHHKLKWGYDQLTSGHICYIDYISTVKIFCEEKLPFREVTDEQRWRGLRSWLTGGDFTNRKQVLAEKRLKAAIQDGCNKDDTCRLQHKITTNIITSSRIK